MEKNGIIQDIDAGLKDVYSGNGESFTIGGVEFNRFGLRFAGNEHDIHNVCGHEVTQHGQNIEVCIHTTRTDVLVIIPMAYIQ